MADLALVPAVVAGWVARAMAGMHRDLPTTSDTTSTVDLDYEGAVALIERTS
ncbi:MAG: hypothetical protein ACOH17_06665 [Cellulomonas sp.]